MFLRTCIVEIILLTCTNSAVPQDYSRNAVVIGRVYEAYGHPLQGAVVVPFPLEVGTSGPIPFAKTNADGLYRLTLPAFGKTRICARLEDKGYPDTTAAIFASGNENEPEVNALAGAILEDIDIHLPPPNGSVEFVVTDKNSGAIAANARITLRRAADPSIIHATGIGPNGRYKVHLPPQPITVEIRMGGYAPWSYKDTETGTPSLKLLSTDRRVLAVQLIPNSNK